MAIYCLARCMLSYFCLAEPALACCVATLGYLMGATSLCTMLVALAHVAEVARPMLELRGRATVQAGRQRRSEEIE